MSDTESAGLPQLPLAGRRVVVTRAATQAEPLAKLLREFGAEPILMPLIEIVEPSDAGAAFRQAIGRVSSYDWLVVTSPNGAERVRSELASIAIEDRQMGQPFVAAVGTATAAALHGVLARPVDLVPYDQTGAGLAAEFASGAGTVLVVRPEPRDGEPSDAALIAGLAAKGWQVDAVSAYRTVPVVPSSAALLAVLSADAVLFASGSAVRAWVQVFGTETPAIVAAIGPSTAAVAAELGLKLDVVATDHSLTGMVGSLVGYLSDPG